MFFFKPSDSYIQGQQSKAKAYHNLFLCKTGFLCTADLRLDIRHLNANG